MAERAGKGVASIAGLCAAFLLCGQAVALDAPASPVSSPVSPPANSRVSLANTATATPPAAAVETKAEARPAPEASPAPSAKPVAASAKPAKKAVKKKPRKTAKAVADDKPALPPGPLHVIVSLDKQSIALFAGGIQVATAPISSGTRAHPTPMGVFSVLQKNRHHVSNIYGAPMPYMQRLTWSGTALHEGPLPGRPASHGCVRMTKDFSDMLWKVTRIGARVIITRDVVAPVEIAHPALFVPRPAPADVPAPTEAPSASLPPAAREAEARVVRTADASNRLPRAVFEDAARPMVAAPLANAAAPEQPTKLTIEGEVEISASARAAAPPEPAAETVASQPSDSPAAAPVATAPIAAEPQPAIDPKAVAAEAAARAREARRKAAPVSVFVSRREGKLYVRQGMEPLFDAPVTITEREKPIGTHVYTAMDAKDDGLRWTVVSIPSSYPRAEEPARPNDRKQRRNSRPLKAEPVDVGPPSNASEALSRIVIPPVAVARIAAIMKPGSSLIVSDNRMSNETGKTTDFIVETP